MTIIKGRICLQCLQLMMCDCKPGQEYWVDADIPVEEIKTAKRVYFDKDFSVLPKTSRLAIHLANLLVGDESFTRDGEKK